MDLLDIVEEQEHVEEYKRGDLSYKLRFEDEDEPERVLYWVELCFNKGNKWNVKTYWESYFARFKTLKYKKFCDIVKSGVLSGLENRCIYKALQEYNPPKTSLKECFSIYKKTGGAMKYSAFIKRAIFVSSETCLLSLKDLFKPQYICNRFISRLNKSYLLDIPFLNCATLPKEVGPKYNGEFVICYYANNGDWEILNIKELRGLIIDVYICSLNLTIKDVWVRYCDEVEQLSYRQFLRYYNKFKGETESVH